MNDILKQRLVGALILVALGVVFWPIIFVQPEEQTIAEVRAIPPSPGVPSTPVTPPTGDGLRASPQLTLEEESALVEEEVSPGERISVTPTTPTVSPAPAARTTRTEAPESLALDSEGIPLAWTLQVATLSSTDKADKLRQQLLDMNHKAYISQVRRDGKVLYRVCIGPQFERVQLEQLRKSIDAKFGVRSLVARYIP